MARGGIDKLGRPLDSNLSLINPALQPSYATPFCTRGRGEGGWCNWIRGYTLTGMDSMLKNNRVNLQGGGGGRGGNVLFPCIYFPVLRALNFARFKFFDKLNLAGGSGCGRR